MSTLNPEPSDRMDCEVSDRELGSPIHDLNGSLHVEAVSGRVAASHHIAWADLRARALEPNVFLEPGFAVPLMQHVEPHKQPDVLLVWEENSPTSFGRLIGLMPIALPRRATPGIARAYRDEQIALGGPLLDKARTHDAFAAMIAWLRDNSPRAGALLFTTIPSGGRFEAIATEVCRRQGLLVRRLDQRGRAVFQRDPEAGSEGVGMPSAKRRKEWRRQERRLSEVGARTYRSATTPSDVTRALERFLALEHNGWKGRRGTSLLADGRRATFARTMTRLMAHEGQCRIEAIEIDGRPVAMGILLTTGARAHFWKTAFDEGVAMHSPGVQLVREMTERLRVDPDIITTDSCALPGHTLIDRLWPQRMTVIDLMIEIEPGGRGFEHAWRLENLRRRLRARIKTVIARLRRR